MNGDFEEAGLRVFERGWLSSNNVLFPGDANEPSMLIDSGYWSHAPQTVALVRSALGGRPLDRLVNTHLHSDHCGGNQALQFEFGCAIDVPAGEVAKVDAWDEDALTYRATGQHCPRFPRTGSVAAGGVLRCGGDDWQMIAAPGHDPESVVLYQAERKILISADALWENGFGVVFPELEGIGAFDEVRLTLDAIGRLPIKWVIPGHGAPFQDVDGAMRRAYKRLYSFVADPVRHARYAAKVLIKFHALEFQQETVASFREWLNRTPYFQTIRRLYFANQPLEVWQEGLVRELCEGGALRVEDGFVRNV